MERPGADRMWGFHPASFHRPSPSWALTERVGWSAPGDQDALLGAPCPVGRARGAGTGPRVGGGAAAAASEAWKLEQRSRECGRGLREGRRLCAQGAGPAQRWLVVRGCL